MDNIIYSIKNFFSENNKQKFTLLAMVVGVMVIIIFAISFAVKLIGVSISYEDLEEKLVEATESYMEDYPNNLPTETNQTTVVSATTLIENEYIKELKKYVKDPSCTANINVNYNNGNYEYVAFLTCNKFKTEKLIDVIKNNNEISSFGEGLYDLNNELVYRGQNPNNYVKFADEMWRIVKVNRNGQFILIKEELETSNYGLWDNRYNTEAGTQKGINNFSISRVLSALKETYEEKYEEYDEYLTAYDVCVGKRSNNDILKDGSVECRSTLSNQNIGLLPIYDYMNASLDSMCLRSNSKECQNYNYLVNSKDKWWTVTGSSENTYDVYYINSYGQIESDDATISANYRYVIALNNNILYKDGNGTLEDPYLIR